VFLAAGQQHPSQARVQRQLGQPAAGIGQLAFVRAVDRERAELAQRSLAIAHQAPIRRLHEGKRLDVAQLQRMHLQDHGGEIGALDLGFRERRTRQEILLGIQADGDARGHAAAAARALVGRCLRDLLDGQALQAAAMAVSADARDAGVDDRADAGYRQRSFGDIGGEHHAAPACGFEHA
jgi:hypothetical protein